MSEVREELGPGAHFDARYEIGEVLGEGGFGTVYKAEQLATGQHVALKILKVKGSADAESTERRNQRFLLETKLSAKLYHPNIVHLVDAGRTADGQLYTVFAYVPGISLAALLEAEGALNPEEAKHLMLQVLDALACAHAQGVVHRDLKPRNIMVVPTGARRNALVVDFGIGALLAREASVDVTRITVTNEVMGTPGYSAPEQWRGGTPTASADLFALALVFAECLTGAPVYKGAFAADVLANLLGPDPVPLPPLLRQHPLGTLLRRMLRKEPEARDLQAAEALSALLACDMGGLSVAGLRGADDQITRAHTKAGQTPRTRSTGSLLGAERRQVALLCVRLELSATNVGESAVVVAQLRDELLQSGLHACSSVAERFGGVLVGALGQIALYYFGYPRNDEHDAVRAARAAREVRHALELENERHAAHAARLGVRVGMHAALVHTPSWLAALDPTLLQGAAQARVLALCAEADDDEIVVSDEAGSLLADRFALVRKSQSTSSFVFQLGAEIDHRPLGAPKSSERAMFGRSAELESILTQFQRATQGVGQTIVVVGEPGIGKSRLLREARQRVLEGAHLVIEARCVRESMTHALHPVIELLDRALGIDRSLGGEACSRHLARALELCGLEPADELPLLAPLLSLPILAPFAAFDLAPGKLKERTFESVLNVFFALTETQPALLVVEDLHWADPLTLDLLAAVAREASTSSLCLLMSVRADFVPELAGAQPHTLHLDRLESAQVAAMISGLLEGKDLSPRLVEYAVARTDGIPLFVEELVRMLADEKLLVDRGDETDLSDENLDGLIPSSLRGLLTARLDRLRSAKETAQRAAAIGREFRLELLTEINGPDTVATHKDVESLTQAGLLFRRRRYKESRYFFKHALLRDAAYESMTQPVRERVHALIAQALEANPSMVESHPELLAHHFAAAQRKDVAAGYALKAASASLHNTSFQVAADHASAVLGWLDAVPAERRVETELDANAVLSQVGMAARGWTDPGVKALAERSSVLLREVQQGSVRHISTLWSLFAYYHTASERERASELADQLNVVADATGDSGLRAAAAMMRGIARHVEGNVTSAASEMERAIALYDRVLHRRQGHEFGMDTLVLAKTTLAQLRWLQGSSEEAFALVEEGIAWARQIEHVPSLTIGLLYAALVYVFEDDKEGARVVTEEALTLARRHGLPAFEGYLAMIHAWTVGDDSGVESVVQILVGMGCNLLIHVYRALGAYALCERGELDTALARLDEGIARAERDHELFYVPELLRRRALLLLQARPDSLQEVQSGLAQAAEQARQQGATRIEYEALRALLELVGDDTPVRARLESLLESHPALRGR